MVNPDVNQKVFLIDAGNSAVKWTLSSDSGLSTMLQKSYPENISEQFFSELWKHEITPDAILVSCVANEQIYHAIEKACLRLWHVCTERIVSPKQWHGLSNAYPQASQLGSDRWCAIVGAYQQAKSDFIVVDCGTAITIDVVNKAGQHLGGYILPGITMMQQSLGMHTAQINLIQNQRDRYLLTPGRSTTDCVQSGVYIAAVKTIDSVFKEQQKVMNNIQCYLTGGDAQLIAALLTEKCIMIPDLVLRGLACIAGHLSAEKIINEGIII